MTSVALRVLFTVSTLCLSAGSTHAQLGSIPSCADVDASLPSPPCHCLDSSDNQIVTPGVYCTCTDTDGSIDPSPNTCDDMLQGRRELSLLDDFVITDASQSGSSGTFRYVKYLSTPDSSDPNLGSFVNSATTVTVNSASCSGGIAAMPYRTRLGRPFATANDFIVHSTTTNGLSAQGCYVDLPGTNLQLVVEDPLDANNKTTGPAFQGDPSWHRLVLEDFDFDGHDDVLFLGLITAKVFSAVDVTDPKKGLKVFTSTPTGADLAPMNDATTGDFNGDGLIDVAWVGGDFTAEKGSLTVFFATVCPGDVDGSPICSGAERFEIVLDPAAKLFASVSGATSYWVLENASLAPNICSQSMGIDAIEQPLRAGAVALGNYEQNGQGTFGRPFDELVVTYVSGTEGKGSDLCSVDVWYFSYTPPDPNGETNDGKHPWMTPLTPVKGLVPINDDPGTVSGAGALTNLFAEAAYLDWFGPTEQAVIGVGRSGSLGATLGYFGLAVAPITVAYDGGSTPSVCVGQTEEYSPGEGIQAYYWGMAVGRFTSTEPDSNEESLCGTFPPAEAGDCPYNPQIAMLLAEPASSSGFAARIQLFNVLASVPGGSGSEACNNDKNISSPFFAKLGTSTNTSGFGKPPEPFDRAGSLLQVGDTRGLSTRLGEPTVVRVTSHNQPGVVIQSPPMHVDYAAPIQSLSPNEQAQILNLTVHPSFWTQYVDETTSEMGASYGETSSYSSSWTEQAEESVTFGAPLVESATIDFTQTFNEWHTHTTSKQVGDYETERFGITSQTLFSDNVIFEQTSFNIYHYPYIGQSICPSSLECDASDPTSIQCPASFDPSVPHVILGCEETANDEGCECKTGGTPSCPALPSDADTRACMTASNGDACCTMLRQPMNLTLSGPQTIVRELATGDTLEWYQPVHMPKQVLSYPRSIDQALARKSGYESLAGQTSDEFSTSVGASSADASWTCTQTATNSVADTHGFSYDLDFSFTEGRPEKQTELAGNGASSSQDVDYSHSSSNTTLNQSSFTHTSSKGVQVNIASSNFIETAASDYDYLVTPMVLGTSRPPNVLDVPPLKVCSTSDTSCIEGSSDPTDNPDCTTTGPLLASYAADLSNDAEVGWWGPNYTSVDIALNHPSRWFTSLSTTGVDDTNFQCRGFQNQLYCTVINPPSANSAALADVWSNGYYSLRGFFITVGGTAGTTRSMAAPTDQVYLQLRVYNFSLEEMPSDSKALVRFYAQQVNPTFDPDGNVDGISYVGTGMALGDPVPVVNPNDGSPTVNAWSASKDNYSVATTSFIPSDVGMSDESYWMFWVVAYPEGVTERAGHGLGSSFDPGTAYPYITSVPLESVAIDGNSKNQRVFSNNVGLYKQLFHVSTDETEFATARAATRLEVGPVRVAPPHPRPGGSAVVATEVYALGGHTSGVSALLRESGAGEEGRIFDVENLSHIREDSNHSVRVAWHPAGCGTREIRLDAHARGLHDQASASIEVPCEPGLVELTGRVDKLGSRWARLRLSATLDALEPLDLGRTRIRVESLLRELSGAGELVQGLLVEPQILRADPHSKGKRVFFQPRPGESFPAQISLKQHRGRLELMIDVSHETIASPVLCGGHPKETTEIQTSLLLDDGYQRPQRIVFDPQWTCELDRGRLRVRSGSRVGEEHARWGQHR